MPVTDRTMKLGQIEELKQRLAPLESRAAGILGSLRCEAYPAPLSSPLDMDAERIFHFASEYRQVAAEGRKVRQAIETLKDELGIV